MFKSIELFAGAGGFALGLEQAGFEHIGLVEFDKSAANTLMLNRPQWKVLCEDIAITTQKDLEKEFDIRKGELDLLSGGAPCQSFSYAGKRLGLQDVRGTMFYHYATFLEKLQPLADEKKATLGQLVIRWTIEHPGITVALVGARNPEQAIQNAKAADIILTPEELQFINQQIDQMLK